MNEKLNFSISKLNIIIAVTTLILVFVLTIILSKSCPLVECRIEKIPCPTGTSQVSTPESTKVPDDTIWNPEITQSIKKEYSTEVIEVNFDMLYKASQEDAIKYIQNGFNHLNKMNSLGVKVITSEGSDEKSKTYTAKYEKDESNGLNYEISNIYYIEIGDTFYKSEKQIGHIDGGSLDFAFLLHINYTLNNITGEYESIPDHKFHLSEDMPRYAMNTKEIKLDNGLKGVEYRFEYSPDSSYQLHYLIQIGEDGLIYLLQIPNIVSYTEYSNFEYNKKYNLNIKNDISNNTFDIKYLDD